MSARSITIGAYDGVHLGHPAVIAQVRRLAAALDARSVVVTFDRHPASVVRPESAPRLLTDLDAEARAAGRRPVSTPRSCWHFDEARADESARQLRRGGARRRAGHEGRRRRRGLPLRPPPRGQRRAAAGARAARWTSRSSRSSLVERAGRRRRAGQLDGHPASARRRRGRRRRPAARPTATRRGAPVVTGDKRGRLLGFPTANVEVPNAMCLPGRRRVRRLVRAARRVASTPAPSTSAAGRRSTSTPTTRCSRPTCSTSTTTSTASGREVRFRHFLRSERKFDGIDALVAQLKHDVESTRRVLGA